MTVTRIESLTEEQRAEIPAWVETWIKRGLSTEPADRETFIRAAEECYKYSGQTWHGRVEWASNPLEGARMASRLAFELAGLTPTAEELRQHIQSNWNQHLGGCWWAAWPAFESFFRKVCGLTYGEEMDARAEAYLQAQMSVGWWWPYASFVVATERPEAIHLEETGPNQHRLHNPSGHAIKWRDGWGLCFWRGVHVPDAWIFTPDKVDPAQVLAESNVEKRRAGCEILGWARVLQDLQAKVIDEDQDPMIGVLLSLDLPGAPDSRFLKVLCGTGRTFMLPVPQTCKTAREANAATYGLQAQDLDLEIRT